MRLRLATFNYKSQFGDPDVKHLGFIIEDNPNGVAVDPTREHVDLYAYISMAVAAIKVQEKEIADLRRQLEEATEPVCGVKAPNETRRSLR